MDIAALSIVNSQASLLQSVGIQVLSLAKDQSIQQSNDLLRMMEQSINPNIGKNLDIKV